MLLLVFFSCKNDKEATISTRNSPFLETALDYKEKGKLDSALNYFYKAKIDFQNKKDTLGIAKSLVNIGVILTEKGDFYGGQETSLDALQFIKSKTLETNQLLFLDYTNLGNANYSYGDYRKAIYFYDLALKHAEKDIDSKLTLNFKGNCYRDLKEYDKALAIYNEALANDTTKNKEWARIVNNEAKTRWLKNNNYNPEPNFHIALQVCVDQKDFFCQYISHYHMTEYYKETNQPEKALFHARKMYELSIKTDKPDAKSRSLRNLAILEKGDVARAYFQDYLKLSDSLNNARNLAKSQYALIRYESEQNKVDFLKAQADNVSKQNQILWQYSVTALLIISLISGATWYARRQKRLEKEKELEVQSTKLTYSKKVHDHVANKIYHLISEIEYNEKLDKDDVLDKLEPIYETSRNISYDFQQTGIGKNFGLYLNKILKSYSSSNTQIFIVGNEEFIWESLDKNTKDEILIVLQELMTNMKKHSGATGVSLKFLKTQQDIKIDYHDNGVGINTINAKNGISGALSRIKAIGGTIKFDSVPDQGLDVSISIPLN